MADISIVRGDDYKLIITLTNDTTPFDLTGYTAKAQIRPTTQVSAPLTAEFAVNIPAPATDGIIELTLEHADTEGLTSNGFWDLQITETATSWVTTIVSGAVTIVPDVTRV